MTECSYCKLKIGEVLPHKCKYCDKYHCHKHLLPESHECAGLKEHKKNNQDKWKRRLVNSKKSAHKAKQIQVKPKEHKKSQSIRKANSRSSVEKYFLYLYERVIIWLNRREHSKYDLEGRAFYVLSTSFLFLASLFSLSIFYSNAAKFNEIDFWIIKLGGALILVSLFFFIKFGWRLAKEVINITKRQRNWFKLVLLVFVTYLLWQAHTNSESVLNPLFDAYNNTNFSLFSPIDLERVYYGTNLTSSHNNRTLIEDIVSFFRSEPERKDQCMASFDKLNKIRKDNGKREISWDDRAYNLAVSRAKDMYDRNYFDHVTPEGKCAEDFKREYGFSGNEYLAENLGGMSYYSKGNVAGNCDESLNGWLESRGHRYNLLYTTHRSGAIGCYHEICVFFGVNRDGFGAKPCTSGAQGTAFWDVAPRQPGEV